VKICKVSNAGEIGRDLF